MKRGGPLKRKTPMKRTAMKRRARPRPRAPGMPGFRGAAEAQIVCAVCGKAAPWHPHHVVEAQYLRANGLPENEPENALRVCATPCHEFHTSGAKRIPLAKLRDENIRHAFYRLGGYAYYYLTERYAGEDPRLERALAEAEAT